MARKRGPGDKPGLKDEDRALWEHVTRDTKPLAKRELPPARAATPKASTAKMAPRAEKAAQPAKPKPRSSPRPLPRPRPAAPAKRAEPPLEHGRAASLDRRSAERLKRGQLPVEARLDLHGYTQDQAHGELDRFLATSQARGLRCVLVITGKGTTTGAGGVLRSQVPRWLNEPANRARVLAFDYAHKHGGLGALYVMIRRKKG